MISCHSCGNWTGAYCKLNLICKELEHWTPKEESRTDAQRPSVKVFAIEMEKQLRANDHKGGWGECTPTFLMTELNKNRERLRIAIMAGNLEQVVRRAANVANFAMMLAENEGRLNASTETKDVNTEDTKDS